MNKELVKILSILTIIVIVLSSFAYVYTEERKTFLQGEAHYSLTYHYDVQNTGPLNLTSLTIRLAKLKSWDPVQTVNQIQISPEPNRTTTDEYQNQFIYYEFDTFLVGQTLNITINVDIDVHLLDFTSLDLSGKAYDNQSDDYLLYSSYDALTDPTDPKIMQVAKNLGGGSNDPIANEFAVYNFTSTYLNYRLLSTSRGASFALSQGYGDCDEYQNLFISLSQARGIPAIGHSAWLLNFVPGQKPDGQVFTDQGAVAHAFPMFLAPEVGFLPVDPTRGANSLYDNWLKTDYKTITLTRGPNHPYRLLNYKWKPDAILGSPTVSNIYSIKINSLNVEYFSHIRQIILGTLIAMPTLFATYNIIAGIKSKELKEKKLDQLLSPTYQDNERDF